MAAINLPFAASATRRAPDADELANGFGCGDADRALFDWLAWWETGQIASAITKSGQTVDDTDLLRLTKAVRSQGLNFIAAANVAGSANAITLAFDPAFTDYAQMVGVPVVFIAEATSTGAVTINVDTLGTKAVTWPDGSAMVANDIQSTVMIIVRYDGVGFRLQTPLSPSQVRSTINSAPFYGINAAPGSNSIASGGVPTTLISSYGTVTNQLGPNSTFTGGVLTIGAGEDGFFSLAAYVNTNLPRAGTGGTANPYPWVLTIDISTDGGTTWASIASNQDSAGAPSQIFGPQPNTNCASIKLAAGNKIRVTAGHSAGVNLSFPVNFSAAFLGK